MILKINEIKLQFQLWVVISDSHLCDLCPRLIYLRMLTRCYHDVIEMFRGCRFLLSFHTPFWTINCKDGSSDSQRHADESST